MHKICKEKHLSVLNTYEDTIECKMVCLGQRSCGIRRPVQHSTKLVFCHYFTEEGVIHRQKTKKTFLNLFCTVKIGSAHDFRQEHTQPLPLEEVLYVQALWGWIKKTYSWGQFLLNSSEINMTQKFLHTFHNKKREKINFDFFKKIKVMLKMLQTPKYSHKINPYGLLKTSYLFVC